MVTRNICVACVAFAGALACGWVGGARSSDEQTSASQAASEPPPAPEARQVGESFVKVAERLAPSVVLIATVRKSGARGSASGRPGLNPFEGTPFEHFFDDGSRAPAPRAVSGMGSGVVIDAKGHILTNNHVVAEADDLKVTFADGKELPAKVVGTDPKTDLAVIRADGANAPPAEFGDSESMRVGQWVIAIGNPFGLDHSVTVGVLSAKGRHGFAPDKLEDFLQTDASINPGNSGGPLVDLAGRVIGINTMIAGLGTGVGFAVSSTIAKPIALQLIEHGKVTRPYVGIAMQAVTPDLAKALGGSAPEHGAIVSQVQAGSPAEKAGILRGDVVLGVAGKSTKDPRDVQHAVLGQKIGAEFDVQIWRDGKEISIRVRAAELPAETAAGVPDRQGQAALGLGLQTLTPDMARKLGPHAPTQGAVVSEVRPGSPAAEAGIREGDVLAEIDRKPVTSSEDAGKRLHQPTSTGHLVLVFRDGASVFIVLRAPSD